MNNFKINSNLNFGTEIDGDIIFQCENFFNIENFLQQFSIKKNKKIKNNIVINYSHFSFEEKKKLYKEKSEFVIKNNKIILRNTLKENLLNLLNRSVEYNKRASLNYFINNTIKIISWNINGLRAFIRKGGIELINKSNIDIICFQENKLSNEIDNIFPQYFNYHCISEKKGYAGVSVYTKIKPLNIIKGIDNKEFDNVGRCLTLEFDNVFLINVYVLNSGSNLEKLNIRQLWDNAFFSFISTLKNKNIILCGDLNVAHKNIDIDRPSFICRAGCTKQERNSFNCFLEKGYVDIFRNFYPEKIIYSYLSYTVEKNKGLRLDYFIVNKELVKEIKDIIIHDKILYSDHVPVTLFINRNLFFFN